MKLLRKKLRKIDKLFRLPLRPFESEIGDDGGVDIRLRQEIFEDALACRRSFHLDSRREGRLQVGDDAVIAAVGEEPDPRGHARRASRGLGDGSGPHGPAGLARGRRRCRRGRNRDRLRRRRRRRRESADDPAEGVALLRRGRCGPLSGRGGPLGGWHASLGTGRALRRGRILRKRRTGKGSEKAKAGEPKSDVPSHRSTPPFLPLRQPRRTLERKSGQNGTVRQSVKARDGRRAPRPRRPAPGYAAPRCGQSSRRSGRSSR